MRIILTSIEERALKKGMRKGLREGMKKGMQIGRNEGIQIGINESIREAVFTIAKNMKKLGLDISIIKSSTGLTEKEITNL